MDNGWESSAQAWIDSMGEREIAAIGDGSMCSIP